MASITTALQQPLCYTDLPLPAGNFSLLPFPDLMGGLFVCLFVTVSGSQGCPHYVAENDLECLILRSFFSWVPCTTNTDLRDAGNPT